MIARLVHMHFKEDYIPHFLKMFDEVKDKIANQPGCHLVHLLQDPHKPNEISTYSVWESEAHLNNYRKSTTFGEVWPSIKPWFKAKPEAWSVNAYFNGFESKQTKK